MLQDNEIELTKNDINGCFFFICLIAAILIVGAVYGFYKLLT